MNLTLESKKLEQQYEQRQAAIKEAQDAEAYSKTMEELKIEVIES